MQDSWSFKVQKRQLLCLLSWSALGPPLLLEMAWCAGKNTGQRAGRSRFVGWLCPLYPVRFGAHNITSVVQSSLICQFRLWLRPVIVSPDCASWSVGEILFPGYFVMIVLKQKCLLNFIVNTHHPHSTINTLSISWGAFKIYTHSYSHTWYGINNLWD